MAGDNDGFIPPKDIKKEWLNLARRLQSVASGAKGNGVVVMNILVLIDQDGTPKMWSAPSCIKLEPDRVSRDVGCYITQV